MIRQFVYAPQMPRLCFYLFCCIVQALHDLDVGLYRLKLLPQGEIEEDSVISPPDYINVVTMEADFC